MDQHSESLHIAYVSSEDPLDKKAWSGSHFSIYSSVQKYLGPVTVLGPYRPGMLIFIGKLMTGFAQLFGKRYNYRHSRFISKAFGKYFTKRLAEKKYDLIIAPAASSEIAWLETNVPIVYISDSTFSASLNYHKALSNLLPYSIKESFHTEKRALEKCTIAALTSPWAANSAISDYGIAADNVLVLPFGANFEEVPGPSFAQNRKLDKICRLLFIGVYWESKGGPIAYAVLKKLWEQGIDAELTICGCVPPPEFAHERIRVIPFLNKKIKSEREQLYHLFAEASFLLFPTRFEAFGIVCCEASAYGLPSIAADTGGVSGVVKNGENGFLVPHSDTGTAYAEKIVSLLNDEEAYKRLCLSSRKRYEGVLNWDAWGMKLKEKVKEIIPGSGF